VLDVLFGGLRLLLWLGRPLRRPRGKNCNFLSKRYKKNVSCIFFNFWSSKPWIRNRIQNLNRIRIHNTGKNKRNKKGINPIISEKTITRTFFQF
jgi:hypothetical protein